MTGAELRILRALARGPLYVRAMPICVPDFDAGALAGLVVRELVELRRVSQCDLTAAGRAELETWRGVPAGDLDRQEAPK